MNRLGTFHACGLSVESGTRGNLSMHIAARTAVSDALVSGVLSQLHTNRKSIAELVPSSASVLISQATHLVHKSITKSF